MGIELGHFALVLAFAIAIVQAGAGFAMWRTGDRVAGFIQQASILQFVLVAAAFVALLQAFASPISLFCLLLSIPTASSR